MVGLALVRRLANEGCTVLTATRDEVDLRRQDQVDAWMAANRPQAVFLAAARVGGIYANDSQPAIPSPRLLASSCARRIAVSMAAISSPPCRPIYMAPVTISIYCKAMSCQP